MNDEIEGAEFVESDLGFTGDADFYKFTGTAGQAIQFVVFAQELVNPPKTFDPAYIDTIITLYNAQMEQIAFNDDPIPQTQNDSQLTTVLPTDGEYFLKINECWSNYDTCAGTEDKQFTDYALAAFNLDPEDLGTVADVEGSETPIDYAVNTTAGSSGYYATTVYGMFDTDTDVDVFPFTVPSDIVIASGRTTAYVEATLTGSDANGATVPQGKIRDRGCGRGRHASRPRSTARRWIRSRASPSACRWSSTTSTRCSWSIPRGAVGHEPVLRAHPVQRRLQRARGRAPGRSPERHHRHRGTDAHRHDTGGGHPYFVAGDLAGADAVDYFAFDVLGVAGDKMPATCSGQRIGSGLRGLKLSVVELDGTLVAGATATETADDNAHLVDGGVDFPDVATLYLKVEKTSQDPLVLGTYYQCGAGFITPMP